MKNTDQISDQQTSSSEAPVTNKRPLKYRSGWIFVLLWGFNVLIVCIIFLMEIERNTVGLLSLALMLGLLLSGIPVGFSLALASLVGLLGLSGDNDIAWTTLQDSTYYGVASWTFAVAPMFVVMGVSLWVSGIADRAYTAARQWFGHLPGGLAIATNFAGAGLASASGSTIGIVMSMSRMAVPEMLKANYKPSLATGSIATGGMLGQIIPPSVLLVIYATIAQTPVGPQLVAAIVPGVLLAILFGVSILIWALLKPDVAPRIDMTDVTWKTRFQSLTQITPVVVLLGIVLGGIFTGIFTVSEAAAVAAVLAVILSTVLRDDKGGGIKGVSAFILKVLRESVTTIAGFFLVLVGSLMMTSLIARSGLAQLASQWLLSLGMGRVAFLLSLTVVFIVLGMFLESLPIILITLPILQPPLEAMGIDMIWFGVFMIIMMEIGAVSPPVGIISFIVHRVVQEPETNLGHQISLVEVFKGVMPFVAASLVMVVALIFWPDIAMWLPNMSGVD